MDFQHREGSTGSAGVAGHAETNVDRRERLRRLALETIDLAKDPYFMKNHLGSYECKLCLTLHTNEGSYLSHTQGKKHQQNLARRAAKEAASFSTSAPGAAASTMGSSSALSGPAKKPFQKIGRPGYKITKIKDSDTDHLGFLIQVHYPLIARPDPILSPASPMFRFMSSFEQKVEPSDRLWQYLVVAADPYEPIAFKIPAKELLTVHDFSDEEVSYVFTNWDLDSHTFTIQFLFKG